MLNVLVENNLYKIQYYPMINLNETEWFLKRCNITLRVLFKMNFKKKRLSNESTVSSIDISLYKN